MPVKQTIPFSEGIFSITFTYTNWLPLIEKVNGFDIIYKWVDHLKSKDIILSAMYSCLIPARPDGLDVHAVIGFRKTVQSINTIIGNGKRFMAY